MRKTKTCLLLSLSVGLLSLTPLVFSVVGGISTLTHGAGGY